MSNCRLSSKLKCFLNLPEILEGTEDERQPNLILIGELTLLFGQGPQDETCSTTGYYRKVRRGSRENCSISRERDCVSSC